MKFKPGRGAPMAEQARLDVLRPQRLAQQRIVEQIDLPDREVVGGAPIAIEQIEVAARCRPIVVDLSCSCRPSPSDRHQLRSGAIDPWPASNGIAATGVLREVKGARPKFGRLLCMGLFFEFFVCVLDLFLLRAILAS